jgi:hypothetical protein
MRGATALPWSETLLRMNGTRRNLGDLISPNSASADVGHGGKSRRRSRRGSGEESDGCIVPTKPRTKLTGVSGGDGGGKAADRRKGEPATHAPGSVPELACHRSGEPTDRRRPHPRSRPTFDRSPVRESRTPGSVRGDRGNPVPLYVAAHSVNTDISPSSKESGEPHSSLGSTNLCGRYGPAFPKLRCSGRTVSRDAACSLIPRTRWPDAEPCRARTL